VRRTCAVRRGAVSRLSIIPKRSDAVSSVAITVGAKPYKPEVSAPFLLRLGFHCVPFVLQRHTSHATRTRAGPSGRWCLRQYRIANPSSRHMLAYPDSQLPISCSFCALS
jgi:hypothetical protein